jgi:hypothetical protein
VHSKAGDHSLSGIRENAVYVALGDAADMHLNIRQACTFDAVLKCVTCLGEPRRVHDKPVYALIHRLIDAVDRLPLDIPSGRLMLPALGPVGLIPY